MRCPNCGLENPAGAAYCGGCGAPLPLQQGPAGVLGPTGSRVLALLQDQMFMVLCILESVGVGLMLVDGNFPLLSILTLVFLWLTFAQARKGVADSSWLRCTSGVLFAKYVICWVAFGLVALSGVLCGLFSGIEEGAGALNQLAYQGLAGWVGSAAARQILYGFSSVAVVLAVALILVAAIGMALNFFANRKVHLFAQSLYRNLGYGGQGPVCCGAARSWLFALGALQLLFSFGDGLTGFFGSASIAAAMILGGVLIGRYFGDLQGSRTGPMGPGQSGYGGGGYGPAGPGQGYGGGGYDQAGYGQTGYGQGGDGPMGPDLS